MSNKSVRTFVCGIVTHTCENIQEITTRNVCWWVAKLLKTYGECTSFVYTFLNLHHISWLFNFYFPFSASRHKKFFSNVRKTKRVGCRKWREFFFSSFSSSFSSSSSCVLFCYFSLFFFSCSSHFSFSRYFRTGWQLKYYEKFVVFNLWEKWTDAKA